MITLTSPGARTLLIGATCLALSSPCMTSPVSAASRYQCTTSSKSLDMPQYNGPWPDNYDITVAVCARRTGTTVTVYSSIKWKVPYTSHQANTFDSAVFRVEIKKSVRGTDPVARSRAYDLHDRMERGDGHFTTPTLSYRAGSPKALGDAALTLDWNNDGKSEKDYPFSASPAV